jgi:hypothetical protein
MKPGLVTHKALRLLHNQIEERVAILGLYLDRDDQSQYFCAFCDNSHGIPFPG